MANLKISDLQPTGYDLFSDSESYMMDLSEDELNTTHGGFLIPALTFVAARSPHIALHAVGEAAQIGTKFGPKARLGRDSIGPISWIP